MRLYHYLRKRGLALFMALVMCLSLLPATAMAAEGTSNQTRIVPGVATPVEDQPSTYKFEGLEIKTPTDTAATAIGELDIWFATGVDDLEKDSINVEAGKVDVENSEFDINVTDMAGDLGEKMKGKHLQIKGPDNANPEQQNAAWVKFLKENLTVTLTSDSFDYAVCFGSIPKDFAYNPVNGHYYTYVKTNGGNQGKFEWARAKDAAHEMSGPIEGQKGYLITITTEQEERFVEHLFTGQFWTAGTRDPEVYPKNVDPEVEKLNTATFGTTVVEWAKNGDNSPKTATAKGNGAWFWGDGPADELGLIYYPFAVNPANSSGNSKVSYYEQYATAQWKDPNVSGLLQKYSGKDYKGTYVNSDRELYYHWAQDGIGLIEPNDNTGNRVNGEPPYVNDQLKYPENRELYMHVYGPSEYKGETTAKDEHLRWNDYASSDGKIQGYLVEFDGTTDMQATAYISPVNGTKVTSNFKDTGDQVMIVPGIPEENPDVVSKWNEGKDNVPIGATTTVTKVENTQNPTEYKVVTKFEDGDDSYYSEKIVKLYDAFDYLALSLECTTDDTHGVKYYELLKADGENLAEIAAATPGADENGNFFFTITPRNTHNYDTDVNAAGRTHALASSNPSALVKMSYDAENKEWSASYKLLANAESWTTASKQAVGTTPTQKFIVPFDVKCVAELYNVQKELVKSAEGLENDLKSGVLFLDDSNTYGDIKVESSTIKLGKDESVKLLYKITVTGTKGANYTVSDTGATFLPQAQTSVSGKLGDGQNDGANTTEGLFTDVLYAYRTYTRNDIEASKDTDKPTGTALINTVELKAGDDTKVKDPDPKYPDDPKKTDDEEVPAKKLFNVTVKYVDEDDKELKFIRKDDGTYASEQTVTGIENGTPYRTDDVKALIYSGLVDVNGNHYVKESETVTGNNGNNIKDSDVTITLVYTLDNWDEDDPDKPDPDPTDPDKPDPGPDKPDPDDPPGDDIPDKYQVKVIYKVDGTGTSVPGYIDSNLTYKSEIINLGSGTGTNPYKTSGDIKISGATGVAKDGHKFNVWTQELTREGNTVTEWTKPLSGTGAYNARIAADTQITDAYGLDIYTFTASFQELGTYNVTYKFVYEDKDGTAISDADLLAAFGVAVKDRLPEGKTLKENETVPEIPTDPVSGNTVSVEGGHLQFKIWAKTAPTNPNDKNVEYVGTWVYTKNPTMYDYALIYDCTGGQVDDAAWTGKDTANSPLDTHTFTVTDKAPTRENYIFKGWAESATTNTGDVAYAAGKSVTLTSAAPTKTLYAVWEPIATYTVEYQWATSAPASISLPSKETGFHSGDSFTPATIPASAPVYYGETKIGTWTFGGWFHDKACSEPYPATITKNEIVYGKWTYEAAETTGEITVTKTPDKTEAAVGETVTWTITVTNPNSGRNYTHLDLADMLDGASVSDQSAAIGNGWYLNPGYDIPEEPEKSVYTLTIEYQYADGTKAAETCIMNLPAGELYSVPSPEIPGYEADTPVVTGTMSNPAGPQAGQDTTVTVTYTPKLYTLTINYVNATGSQVADPYTERMAEGAAYSVTSPEVAGYTPAQLVVAGTMPSGDVSETVTYSSAPVIPDTSEDVQDDSQEPQMEMAEATEMALAAPDGALDPHDFSLAPGAVAVFEISYKVQAGDGDTLTNTVTVIEKDNPKPVGDGKSDPVDVLHPNLVVTKVKDSDSPDPAKVGDTITWTITITNTGDGTAYDVNVTDENADSLSQNTIASIAPGASATITASHAVTGSEALEDGRFYNTVIASYKEEDPAKKDPTDPPEDPKETTGKDEGTEIPVALAVQKSANVTTAVNPGSYVTYTITVTNSGHDAENVTVTDVLDSRLTFVSAALNGSPITPNDSVYSVGAVTNAAPAILTITVRVNDNVANNEVIPNVAAATYPNNPEGPEPSNPVNVPVTVPSVIIPDIPFTPTPTPPTIITPTPTPTTGGTTITDEETPLGGSVGLNDTDHFAYVIGYEDDTVRPLNNITRAEAATIFFRLMTDEFRQEHWATTNDFSDVKAGDWYNNAISTCANAGVLKGYDDGTFRPNAPITRAEFASMAAGFMDESITDDGTGDFSDTASHWAAAAIRRAAKAGWVTGTGNKFNPDARITRAEVMTIVNRMLDRTPDKDHMLPEMKKWIDNPESEWYYEAVQEATNEHDYERDELNVETWTELLTVRDWKALETEWANNGGASAPKTDVESVGAEGESK